ncbi:hypothetical protein ACO0LO_16830 [Undibacterium sp. TJN25]|uniref:hypothetical protein n=1 Tax=Undibacterium sp. TJN25 TaxID=3413056 RepID=UPI003BF27364
MLAKINNDGRYLFRKEFNLKSTGKVDFSMSINNGLVATVQLVIRDVAHKDLILTKVFSTGNSGKVMWSFDAADYPTAVILIWNTWVADTTKQPKAFTLSAQVTQAGHAPLPVSVLDGEMTGDDDLAGVSIDGLRIL